ncbi:MAG: arylsulfotransferase family protein, partial [Acidobacteriota bacterium]|nr:arylsulfotransferase family protein [Acidobacteriota bacterium]
NPGSGVASFVSRPDLRPALVRITELAPAVARTEPRFFVLAPMADVPYASVQRGPMLVDHRGRTVWYQPTTDATFDVQVQAYKGQRVLTWWHGELFDGYGAGVGEIVDESYTPIATVGDARTRPLDLHEFQLTSRGTALATHYETRRADLSSVGGPANGVLLVGHALEIDVATNETLLDWASIDHVGLDESYQPLPSAARDPFNYFHINSVAEAPDGNLLISGRNTWCVYKVHRTTGEVMWRLNGKRSDFQLPDAAGFSWQHHARAHRDAGLTVFDNANISGHGSLALMLRLDERRRRVSLERAFQHPARFTAWTLGSMQVRADGNVFVGWGAQPYFSEFS